MSEKYKNMYWVLGEPIVSPLPATALLVHKCLFGVKTFIHGIRVSSTDGSGNIFTLKWKHKGKVKSLPPDVFSADGTVHLQDNDIPYNGMYPADVDSDIIVELAQNGNVGTAYQAALLVREELIP